MNKSNLFGFLLLQLFKTFTFQSQGNVRLVGGRSSLEGRVEVKYYGVWGTVCDDDWDNRDAGVICSMLGFSRSLSVARIGGYFPAGTGRINLDDVNCVGSELSISDCKHGGWRNHNCGHDEDAGVTCAVYITNDDVRLVGGASALEGRVEIKYKGVWGTVCDDDWDSNDAGVVCSMLGYSREMSVARQGGYFSKGTGRILLDNVNCVGSELSISNCTHEGWTTNDCGHSEDAGVTCTAQSTSTATQSTPTTAQSILTINGNNVRLRGGSSAREGRVEVKIYGIWRTVCDKGWDDADAAVVCSMLGYPRFSAVAKQGGVFPGGSSLFIIKNVRCTGLENSIRQCHYQQSTTTHFGTIGQRRRPIWQRLASSFFSTCSHSDDAGVVCSSSEDSVRLVGSRSSLEGRVEIKYKGAWGTVCDDDWDNRDAGVICSMLGFSRTLSVARIGGYFPAGTGSIILDDVNCVGSELSISECKHGGWRRHNCGHSEDAGVTCAVHITNDDVRLVGGGSALEGRVEIKYKGAWGTVCDDGWDNNDAGVVCSMLGYSRALSVSRQGGYFSNGTGRILLDNVNCVGSELTISNCTHEGWTTHDCGHNEDAGVTCTAQSTSTTVQSTSTTAQSTSTTAQSTSTTAQSILTIYGNNVRIRGGSSAREGRVEVKIYGIWRTVCDEGWDDADAAVVCSMLGYPRFPAVAKQGGFFPSGSGSLIIKNVRCNGMEDSIEQCQYQQSTIHHFGTTGRRRRPIWEQLASILFSSCSHSDDAGVVCSSSEVSGKANVCGSADILFIMDASGSVGRSNFRTMKNFVKNIISSFSSTNTRFSAITYGSDVKSEFEFGEYRSKFMTLLKVDRISYTGRSTNTHKALQYARRTSFISSKSNVAKIVILITDGKSNNPSRTTTEASLLRRRGVHIFSIGIGSGPKIRELNSIASDPDKENVFTVTSFTYLSSIKNAVSKRTCEATVDGGFTEWSTWSVCSVSCNGGYKSRNRTCTNPVPSNNGNNCTGEYHQLMPCQESPCTVDGGFTSWSAWGECSKSCGRGEKERLRTCTNPSPSFGGRPCYGSTLDTQICHNDPCAISGGFSSWSSWTDCLVTCGVGTKTRTRSCSNPAPAYGGQDCIGNKIQVSECSTAKQCPVHGEFGDWSEWTPCSKSCGSGSTFRTRFCSNPSPSFGGRNCVGENRQEIKCEIVPCPVDGGYTDWNEWSSCSASCGTGQITRNRSCTNPTPAFGGNRCNGSQVEVKKCLKTECPVDGGFSSWGMWLQCSRTCGGGMKSRHRLCNNPAPMYGGRNCSGDVEETNKCNAFPCPVHGDFSEWETWSTCSVSCGGGYKIRQRTCSDPSPIYGGRPCQGHFSETLNCMTEHCPVDGGVSNWTSWSACSRTCGTGTSFHKRFCTNPIPQYGGKNCSEILFEQRNCKVSNCPIHGKFSDWSSWSKCTKTCNGGFKKRSRKCDSPEPKYGGNNCSGRYNFTTVCNTRPCPINGGFGKWSTWLECSVSCGSGTRRRGRSCSNPMPMHGGLNCSGDFFELAVCNKYPCPIDGNFSDWSTWTACYKSCGGGIKIRERKCNNPSPLYGGMTCVGNFIESLNCNTFHCPIHGGFTEWETWSKCTVSCGGGTSKRYRSCINPFPRFNGNNCTGEFDQSRDCNFNHCPIDGDYSSWGGWSDCTTTCGIGSKIRNRICDSPKPQYGGRDCLGDSREMLECIVNPCPIDGEFGPWSDWSTCSSSCDDGVKNRSRVCNNPSPAFGGKNCSGSSKEQMDCNILPCPLDGGFSKWSLWTDCSKSCGDGYINRNRTCSNPSPQFGGSDCLGNTSETVKCKLRECPIHGRFSTWGEWSECTSSCDGGLTVRQRSCSYPEPRYGGDNCSGSFHETSPCNENPCPIHGGYTSWSSWTNCNVSCGGGTSLRRRTCSNPKPKFGGTNCSGTPMDSKQCSTFPCPVDGNFTSWGQWSECSVSCGGGLSTRERTCTNPRPAFGGKDCLGEKKERKPCNTQRCSICDSGEIECANLKDCVRYDYVCDGIPDCPDNSDEAECGKVNTCPEGLYRCPDGECVSDQSKCQ